MTVNESCERIVKVPTCHWDIDRERFDGNRMKVRRLCVSSAFHKVADGIEHWWSFYGTRRGYREMPVMAIPFADYPNGGGSAVRV